MAREPKGFSKSASGAYTAEDVSYAKQVKQQLAEIIQLQRDGADYDKARLKDLRQEGKLADDILKSRKQYVRAARDESIEFDNLAKNASREVSVGDDLNASITSSNMVLLNFPSNLQVIVLPLSVPTRVVARGWMSSMCGAV